MMSYESISPSQGNTKPDPPIDTPGARKVRFATVWWLDKTYSPNGGQQWWFTLVESVKKYPSSHNHGSGEWPNKNRGNQSCKDPFSTSMVMGGRVSPQKKQKNWWIVRLTTLQKEKNLWWIVHPTSSRILRVGNFSKGSVPNFPSDVVNQLWHNSHTPKFNINSHHPGLQSHPGLSSIW